MRPLRQPHITSSQYDDLSSATEAREGQGRSTCKPKKKRWPQAIHSYTCTFTPFRTARMASRNFVSESHLRHGGADKEVDTDTPHTGVSAVGSLSQGGPGRVSMMRI